MLRLRPYKPQDAQTITTWCQDRKVFDVWGGCHFGEYPLTPEGMNRKYLEENGGCAEADNFYPMTAFDETGVVGHFIMRYLNGDHNLLRFGWVIVDAEKRGKKYGQQMLTMGFQYAFEFLKVEKITIGVYANNPSAMACYTKLGFHEAEGAPESFGDVLGEQIKIIELEITKEDYLKKQEI